MAQRLEQVTRDQHELQVGKQSALDDCKSLQDDVDRLTREVETIRDRFVNCLIF